MAAVDAIHHNTDTQIERSRLRAPYWQFPEIERGRGKKKDSCSLTFGKRKRATDCKGGGEFASTSCRTCTTHAVCFDLFPQAPLLSTTVLCCARHYYFFASFFSSKSCFKFRDLSLFLLQLTRSISSSADANGVAVVSGGGGGGAGSPYHHHRSSSGAINGLGLGLGSARPNLNKELMQKLRSMTETIKMLGEENAELRKRQGDAADVDPKRKGRARSFP